MQHTAVLPLHSATINLEVRGTQLQLAQAHTALERIPLPSHGTYPPSTPPCWLVPYAHGAFLSFQGHFLHSAGPAYQRLAPSRAVCAHSDKQQRSPSLLSLLAHHPTWRMAGHTGFLVLQWDKGTLRQKTWKKKKKSCLCNEEENGRFFCFGPQSSHHEIILPWGTSTTLGHSQFKYLTTALPSVFQITWRKSNELENYTSFYMDACTGSVLLTEVVVR